MPALPEPQSEIERHMKGWLFLDHGQISGTISKMALKSAAIDSRQGSNISLNSLEIFSFYQNLD